MVTPRRFDPCRALVRWHRTVVAVSLAATVAGGALATRLTVDSDLAALLPDAFPSAQAMRAMGEGVVWESHLRVALKTEDFDGAVALAQALSAELAELPDVASVAYRNDLDFYERNALLFLEEERLDSLHAAVRSAMDVTRQRHNPLMVDGLFGDGEADAEAVVRDELRAWEEEYRAALPRPYYANPSRTVLVVDVTPARSGGDLASARALLASVQATVDRVDPTSFAPDVQVFYGGNVRNRITEYETIRGDILGTAAYGVGGVFLLLAVAFRSVAVALLISMSLAASLAWTFGVTFLLLGKLNTITGFLFLVLFGLGVDHGIHAMARYREVRRKGLPTEAALHQMVCRGGRALILSAVTTAAAFFSLTIFDFRGFSELGLITGMGTLFGVLAMLVLLPALVVLAEGRGLLRWSGSGTPGARRASGGSPASPGRAGFVGHSMVHTLSAVAPATILVLSGALTLMATAAFSRVSFQYDLTDLRIMTPEREEYARVTAGVFPPVEVPAVVMTPTPAHVEDALAAVERIRAADLASPTVDRVQWVGSVVPGDQPGRLERVRALRELVAEAPEDGLSFRDQRRLDRLRRSLEVDEPFTWKDVPEKDRARFSAPDGEPGNFVLIYPSVSLRDGRNAMAFRDDVGTFTGASGTVYHGASANVIVADLLTMVTREGPLAVAVALGVVLLIVAAGTRSFRATLFIMTPLLVGLTWTGGLMAAAGMQLNFFNLVVFPSLVGIAVLLTTATTMVGYGGLLFAHHPGLQAIGLVAVMGLAATLLSAVVLLPALLAIFGIREVAGR